MWVLKKRYPKFRIVKINDKFQSEIKKSFYGEWYEIDEFKPDSYLLWSINHHKLGSKASLNTYEQALQLIEDYKIWLSKQETAKNNIKIFNL